MLADLVLDFIDLVIVSNEMRVEVVLGKHELKLDGYRCGVSVLVLILVLDISKVSIVEVMFFMDLVFNLVSYRIVPWLIY